MTSASSDTAGQPASATRYTMPFAWSGATARLAARNGFDPSLSLRQAGLLECEADVHADTPIDPAGFLLTALSLINAFDDELHGVAPQRMAKGTASMAAHAMTASRDLCGAINTMARFLIMIGASCRISLRHSAGFAAIEIHADCDAGTIRSILEEFFAHFVHQQLSYFLGHPLQLEQFTTTTRRHPALGNRHPYLLCPVRHGRSTALTFESMHLQCARRPIQGDSPLSDALMLWLRQHPASGTIAPACIDPLSLTATVYAILRERDAKVGECASLVRMGPVELARALSREATTYRELRRAALLERSRPHLHAGLPLEELSETLGYSDSRSCRRAIKLACGLTIQELRQAPGSEPTVFPAAVAKAIRDQAAGLH